MSLKRSGLRIIEDIEGPDPLEQDADVVLGDPARAFRCRLSIQLGTPIAMPPLTISTTNISMFAAVSWPKFWQAACPMSTHRRQFPCTNEDQNGLVAFLLAWRLQHVSVARSCCSAAEGSLMDEILRTAGAGVPVGSSAPAGGQLFLAATS